TVFLDYPRPYSCLNKRYKGWRSSGSSTGSCSSIESTKEMMMLKTVCLSLALVCLPALALADGPWEWKKAENGNYLTRTYTGKRGFKQDGPDSLTVNNSGSERNSGGDKLKGALIGSVA